MLAGGLLLVYYRGSAPIPVMVGESDDDDDNDGCEVSSNQRVLETDSLFTLSWQHQPVLPASPPPLFAALHTVLPLHLTRNELLVDVQAFYELYLQHIFFSRSGAGQGKTRLNGHKFLLRMKSLGHEFSVKCPSKSARTADSSSAARYSYAQRSLVPAQAVAAEIAGWISSHLDKPADAAAWLMFISDVYAWNAAAITPDLPTDAPAVPGAIAASLSALNVPVLPLLAAAVSPAVNLASRALKNGATYASVLLGKSVSPFGFGPPLTHAAPGTGYDDDDADDDDSRDEQAMFAESAISSDEDTLSKEEPSRKLLASLPIVCPKSGTDALVRRSVDALVSVCNADGCTDESVLRVLQVIISSFDSVTQQRLRDGMRASASAEDDDFIRKQVYLIASEGYAQMAGSQAGFDKFFGGAICRLLSHQGIKDPIRKGAVVKVDNRDRLRNEGITYQSTTFTYSHSDIKLKSGHGVFASDQDRSAEDLALADSAHNAKHFVEVRPENLLASLKLPFRDKDLAKQISRESVFGKRLVFPEAEGTIPVDRTIVKAVITSDAVMVGSRSEKDANENGITHSLGVIVNVHGRGHMSSAFNTFIIKLLNGNDKSALAVQQFAQDSAALVKLDGEVFSAHGENFVVSTLPLLVPVDMGLGTVLGGQLWWDKQYIPGSTTHGKDSWRSILGSTIMALSSPAAKEAVANQTQTMLKRLIVCAHLNRVNPHFISNCNLLEFLSSHMPLPAANLLPLPIIPIETDLDPAGAVVAARNLIPPVFHTTMNSTSFYLDSFWTAVVMSHPAKDKAPMLREIDTHLSGLEAREGARYFKAAGLGSYSEAKTTAGGHIVVVTSKETQEVYLRERMASEIIPPTAFPDQPHQLAAWELLLSLRQRVLVLEDERNVDVFKRQAGELQALIVMCGQALALLCGPRHLKPSLVNELGPMVGEITRLVTAKQTMASVSEEIGEKAHKSIKTAARTGAGLRISPGISDRKVIDSSMMHIIQSVQLSVLNDGSWLNTVQASIKSNAEKLARQARADSMFAVSAKVQAACMDEANVIITADELAQVDAAIANFDFSTQEELASGLDWQDRLDKQASNKIANNTVLLSCRHENEIISSATLMLQQMAVGEHNNLNLNPQGGKRVRLGNVNFESDFKSKADASLTIISDVQTPGQNHGVLRLFVKTGIFRLQYLWAWSDIDSIEFTFAGPKTDKPLPEGHGTPFATPYERALCRIIFNNTCLKATVENTVDKETSAMESGKLYDFQLAPAVVQPLVPAPALELPAIAPAEPRVDDLVKVWWAPDREWLDAKVTVVNVNRRTCTVSWNMRQTSANVPFSEIKPREEELIAQPLVPAFVAAQPMVLAVAAGPSHMAASSMSVVLNTANKEFLLFARELLPGGTSSMPTHPLRSKMLPNIVVNSLGDIDKKFSKHATTSLLPTARAAAAIFAHDAKENACISPLQQESSALKEARAKTALDLMRCFVLRMYCGVCSRTDQRLEVFCDQCGRKCVIDPRSGYTHPHTCCTKVR